MRQRVPKGCDPFRSDLEAAALGRVDQLLGLLRDLFDLLNAQTDVVGERTAAPVSH